MYVRRHLETRLTRLLDVFPVVVITGARQVGKTTLLRHFFGDRGEIVIFDPVIDIENARQDPELFLENHRTPLVLDEIQYAPELIPTIKRRVDLDRTPGCFILTGSQQWGVLRSISESLAGRAVFLDLEGFSLAERAQDPSAGPWLEAWLENPETFVSSKPPRLSLDHSVYELLWRGSLPEARILPEDTVADFHAGYLRTYIERDVRLLADVSDWQTFGRFVRLVAALTSQEINYSQLGRELGLTPQTSRRWLNMLSATLQWFEIAPFSGNLLKRVSHKPKGYIADTGMACAAQVIASPLALGGHPLWGPLFETAVVGELRKQCSLLSPKPALFHWRRHSGAEVDLLIEHSGRIYPIEVKAKSRPSRRDTTGITSFRKHHPGLDIAPGLVLAPCEKVVPLSESDYAVPWDVRLSD